MESQRKEFYIGAKVGAQTIHYRQLCKCEQSQILVREAYIITWHATEEEQYVNVADRSLCETVMSLGCLNEATMLI